MLFLDLYYLAWLRSLQDRAPPFLQASLEMAKAGAITQMLDSISDKLKSETEKRRQIVGNANSDMRVDLESA